MIALVALMSGSSSTTSMRTCFARPRERGGARTRFGLSMGGESATRVPRSVADSDLKAATQCDSKILRTLEERGLIRSFRQTKAEAAPASDTPNPGPGLSALSAMLPLATMGEATNRDPLLVMVTSPPGALLIDVTVSGAVLLRVIFPLVAFAALN